MSVFKTQRPSREAAYQPVKLLCVAGIATAMLFAPVELRAQSSGSMETGSLITNRSAGGMGRTASEARVISRQFALCSVRRGRNTVENYLAAPIGSAEHNRLQKRVLVDDCLGAGELTLPLEVIRGALFEQLYLVDYSSEPVPDLSTLSPIDYTAGYSAPVSGPAINSIALAQFGDCVARADIGNARALLASLPESSAEGEAVRGSMGHLGACVPTGQKVSFSRSVLRSAVAEGLYRLTRAASGTPWGAK
jgi:hypothetical protein